MSNLYTFINATAVDNIRQPNLKDFDLISGPYEGQSTITNNGVVTNSFSFTYIIKPKNKGNFTIPATIATVAGKAYTLQNIYSLF